MLIPYRRVSTEEQAREGVSLAAQEAQLRGYCAAHGLEMGELISDEGVSGTVAPDKRPGLRRALAMLADGEADGLVVIRLDRLTRSIRDLLDLVDLTRAQGWQLHSVTERLDTSSPMGRFVIQILGAVAELERGMISQRTKEALDEKRRGGAKLGAAPFGWRKVAGADGKLTALEPVDEEQAVIKAVREMSVAGLTQDAMAQALNEQYTPTRGGGRWSRRGVQCILSQPESSGSMIEAHAGQEA